MVHGWEKTTSRYMFFITREMEYLLTHQWIQLSFRWEVGEILFCVSIPCLTLRKQQRRCKIKCLTSQDQPGPFSSLAKEPAHNEIRYLCLGRNLEFHFYLSIMHEVAAIRPRSARLPGRGTPINTTALICLSHSGQPCTTSLQWLHSVKLIVSTE